ncbi:hypothetical protein [Ornithinibacillus halotolerans]|uniref:Uncharacterized protein n=1 Tax=Ornithinibacillus halotolerans TaxID=1274357 RepID=A0A916RY31_9BACI|nr:hypothetical protein [Ornithinibacillus halotolerans]GGA75934.1 hypothetical protein GCM10008025_19480 [Ornithinibacillus halotolerans]
MENPFGGEGVGNLISQLEKLKKIILGYQQNDISHDYYRLKSEYNESKVRLLATRQKLSKLEERFKDFLDKYQQLVTERDALELQMKLNNSINDPSQKDESSSVVNETIGKVVPTDRKNEEMLDLKTYKELAIELINLIHLIENKYHLMRREELVDDMEIEKKKDISQSESSIVQEERSVLNSSFRNRILKGAEPHINPSLRKINDSKRHFPKDPLSKTIISRTKYSEEKYTRTTSPNQEKELKDTLKGDLINTTFFNQQLLQEMQGKSNFQVKEFNYKDLKNATSVTSIIEGRQNYQQGHNEKKHVRLRSEAKPVYIKYKDDKQTSSIDPDTQEIDTTVTNHPNQEEVNNLNHVNAMNQRKKTTEITKEVMDHKEEYINQTSDDFVQITSDNYEKTADKVEPSMKEGKIDIEEHVIEDEIDVIGMKEQMPQVEKKSLIRILWKKLTRT